jgi:hypothetical protein
MVKYVVIGLATAGLYGALYFTGFLQSTPIHLLGIGVTWAMLGCAVAALFMGMKLRTN